jgi:hypothetical protein
MFNEERGKTLAANNRQLGCNIASSLAAILPACFLLACLIISVAYGLGNAVASALRALAAL